VATLRDLLDTLLATPLDNIARTRRSATMSLTVRDSDPPITMKATFLDAAGNEDLAGTVAFTSTGPLVLTDHGDGTTGVAWSGTGDGDVTATKTDPDGATTSTPPFGVSVITGDATSGSISVVAPVA
jgi:hypothetical protein